MSDKTLTIKLKTRYEELGALERSLLAFGEATGMSAKDVTMVNLALDELFTNIVAYGFDDDRTEVVRIFLDKQGDELRIRVEDSGKPFNPLSVEPPDAVCALEEKHIGGVGIHLVRKLMDRIRYRRQKNKNVLEFIRHLHENKSLEKRRSDGDNRKQT